MPKNVLLICTDHWPGSLLGCAGHPVVMTPTLDQLARDGVRFSRFYSDSPVCVPARRCLMTGMARYPRAPARNWSHMIHRTLARGYESRRYWSVIGMPSWLDFIFLV